MTRRTFTPEFKRKVVEEHLVGGRTIAAICREYHLGRNLLTAGARRTSRPRCRRVRRPGHLTTCPVSCVWPSSGSPNSKPLWAARRWK